MNTERTFSSTFGTATSAVPTKGANRYDPAPGATGSGETPAPVILDELVDALLATSARNRKRLRQRLVSRINADSEPYTLIERALGRLMRSADPSRLDEAIDVLSRLGRSTETFVMDRLLGDERDDDRRYVMIRALARVARSGALVRAVFAFAGTENASDREAAAEALGEIGTAEAKRRLRQLSKEDPSKLVREAAQDALEDCRG